MFLRVADGDGTSGTANGTPADGKFRRDGLERGRDFGIYLLKTYEAGGGGGVEGRNGVVVDFHRYGRAGGGEAGEEGLDDTAGGGWVGGGIDGVVLIQNGIGEDTGGGGDEV